MEGPTDAPSKEDKRGVPLEVGCSVRDANVAALRIGVVKALAVPNKPRHVFVEWEQQQKRRRPILASALIALSEEEVCSLKELVDNEKIAFNPVSDFRACGLRDVAIAELACVGLSLHKWGPTDNLAAEAQLAEYGLSLQQLASPLVKWST